MTDKSEFELAYDRVLGKELEDARMAYYEALKDVNRTQKVLSNLNINRLIAEYDEINPATPDYMSLWDHQTYAQFIKRLLLAESIVRLVRHGPEYVDQAILNGKAIEWERLTSTK